MKTNKRDSNSDDDDDEENMVRFCFYLYCISSFRTELYCCFLASEMKDDLDPCDDALTLMHVITV